MAALDEARDWLTIFQLPPYAHELRPVELVWSHLKRSLANLAKRNLAQLTTLVKTRLRRMQYREHDHRKGQPRSRGLAEPAAGSRIERLLGGLQLLSRARRGEDLRRAMTPDRRLGAVENCAGRDASGAQIVLFGAPGRG
jgi:hypothetical protein